MNPIQETMPVSISLTFVGHFIHVQYVTQDGSSGALKFSFMKEALDWIFEKTYHHI